MKCEQHQIIFQICYEMWTASNYFSDLLWNVIYFCLMIDQTLHSENRSFFIFLIFWFDTQSFIIKFLAKEISASMKKYIAEEKASTMLSIFSLKGQAFFSYFVCKWNIYNLGSFFFHLKCCFHKIKFYKFMLDSRVFNFGENMNVFMFALFVIDIVKLLKHSFFVAKENWTIMTRIALQKTADSINVTARFDICF